MVTPASRSVAQEAASLSVENSATGANSNHAAQGTPTVPSSTNRRPNRIPAIKNAPMVHRRGLTNGYATFISWATSEVHGDKNACDRLPIEHGRRSGVVARLWNGLPQEEQNWWKHQAKLINEKRQEIAVPPPDGSSATEELRAFYDSAAVPHTAEGPKQKRARTKGPEDETTQIASTAQAGKPAAAGSSGKRTSSATRTRPRQSVAERNARDAVISKYTHVFHASPAGGYCAPEPHVAPADRSLVPAVSASLSGELSPPSLPTPSAAGSPALNVPVLLAAVPVRSGTYASSTGETGVPDASNTRAVETSAQDVQYPDTHAYQLYSQPQYTWLSSPWDVTTAALPHELAPCLELDPTLWDELPTSGDLSYFTDTPNAVDHTFAPGPSTADLLSSVTNRLEPSKISSYSTLASALGI